MFEYAMANDEPLAEELPVDARRPLSPEVLAALVANHREFLAFLERRVGNRATAEDVLQDAFAKSMTATAPLRDEEAATAWFYRMLRNALVDHQRRAGARNRAHESAGRELPETVEQDVESRDLICACIARLATTLKPEFETAVRRVDVEGASIQTFADEAGITANNARVRLFRARAALREQVRTSCGTCASHGCLDCSCGDAPG